jgi:uncharacterized RDD family membrane protein YckC
MVGGGAGGAPPPVHVVGRDAAVGLRVIAHVIDVVVGLALTFGFAYVAPRGAGWGRAAVALFVGYYLLADALPRGQSVGKRLLRLAVVDSETWAACSLAQSVTRNFVRVLGVFDLAGFLGQRGRRLGDLAARTMVVQRMRAGEAVEDASVGVATGAPGLEAAMAPLVAPAFAATPVVAGFEGAPVAAGVPVRAKVMAVIALLLVASLLLNPPPANTGAGTAPGATAPGLAAVPPEMARCYERSPDVLWRVLDGRTHLFYEKAGDIMTIDATGDRVWALLDGNRSPEEITGVVASELGLAEPAVRAIVVDLIQGLEARGAVRRCAWAL